MAAATSLGVHQPIGLRHAIDEGFLSPNPPPSSYTWEIFVDRHGHGHTNTECEDELLTTKTCVIWSRGGIFRKSFRFDIENEQVTQALLTYFPTSTDSHPIVNAASSQPEKQKPSTEQTKTEKQDDAKSPLARALVVFLKTQAHIYFLSGTSHVVHMPFEVESACAAPIGVIIQRKQQANNTLPVTLRLPKVPPNSFVSSQQSQNTPGTEFSIKGLGRPKALPLNLSNTLENMWQPPMETPDSPWPRLVCLTDPLLEIGLVVTNPEKEKTHKRRQGGGASSTSKFLSPAEEIVHVEAIKIPGYASASHGEACIAVTVNRENSRYSVWRLTYLENQDPFIGNKKKKPVKSTRRRSSMAPGIPSGASTPIHPAIRDSFGAPLPGKKPRKSVRIDEREKEKDKGRALEGVLSSLDPQKADDAARRQSRRVSSLLARADLSASQERASFSDQTLHGVHGGRRGDSLASQRTRMSGAYGGLHLGGSFNHGLNSLAEAPVDSLLEELRAGGDFEGFHNMGLDDHEFEGLTHEMLFDKVHSFSMDNVNVRYSLANKPAKTHSKVFILVGPPTATDEQGRVQILLGIQDVVDKRLQLLTLHVPHPVPGSTLDPATSGLSSSKIPMIFSEIRRAQNVIDSCKVTDGTEESILILSEFKAGGRELSLQSPWSQLITLDTTLFRADDCNSLSYSGTHRTASVVSKPDGTRLSQIRIDALCHSSPRGVVDLMDKHGAFHRLRIKLRPSSSQVRKALDVCKSVLPSSHADRLLAGWWHTSQWLQVLNQQAVNCVTPDHEWSSFVVFLLASFMALGHTSETFLVGLGRDVRVLESNSSWDTMELYTTPLASADSPWMQNRSWQWILEDGLLDVISSSQEPQSPSFMARHIELAKSYIASPEGIAAFGANGYLPTAVDRARESRNKAGWSIMLALHLLVEEQTLSVLSPEEVSPGQSDLRAVLWQLAKWLGWQQYEELYSLGVQADLGTDDSALLSRLAIPPPNFNPCVLTWIRQHFTTDNGPDFLTLPQVYAAAVSGARSTNPREKTWRDLTPRTFMFKKLFELLKSAKDRFEAVAAMHAAGFTPQILETLPEAILTPLQDFIFICQPSPPLAWPAELLKLVNRADVSTILKQVKVSKAIGSEVQPPSHTAKWDFRMLCQHLDDLQDHTEETDASERQLVVRTLFREDRRLNEAQNLLSSAKSRVLRLDPKPEWSESEYLEKQKELVTTVATSTLAIPPGRGLLYYSLRYPLLTQKYHISGFNLACIIRPTNNTVSVDKSQFTEEKINWAFFHQGVAGGLAISPQAKGIDTSWILYNKPGQDLSNRHAGFLLALGLNGHLKSVAKWVAFKYLTPKHTMTSIGLLLGLAASYIGTMDSLITRLLSVHVTRMLPRGAAELNLSKHTQTTGIMGIGLLYCNSQHRRMSEIMMSEIEHVEDGEEEDPLRDESYRLAAGFALGFINLGKGNDLKGLRDMRLTEKLLTIATATKRVELVHVLDRSAAAAVVSVALIFMKSEDHIVARKIDVPDTVLQFDYVRPDILLLRTMAKHIILWKGITPSFTWIKTGLPQEYQARHRLTSTTRLQSKDLPFFSILGGLCFALGLRFAGSGNIQVRDLLVHYLDEFIRLVSMPKGNFDSELARSNARMCMDLVALSCATVMAGTGDLVILRRLRALHGRDNKETTYGSHMACHMAIGALFLGYGTATFGNSDLAVAALIVAFYPIFPTTVQDNRAHLQAFRHFWVLATDPRCLVAKDGATGQSLNVPVLISLRRNSPSARAAAANTASDSPFESSSEGVIIRRQTPCLLPPLDDVLRVTTDAGQQGYWNLTIDFDTNPSLIDQFRQNQTLCLRRRPAFEAAFPATLRALGREMGPLAENGQQKDPFEWVFGLGADAAGIHTDNSHGLGELAKLTHAERAVVMDRLGSGGGVGEGEGATTFVDARLVLENDLFTGGMPSREKLMGLRLLFEWMERRRGLSLSVESMSPGAVSVSSVSGAGAGALPALGTIPEVPVAGGTLAGRYGVQATGGKGYGYGYGYGHGKGKARGHSHSHGHHSHGPTTRSKAQGRKKMSVEDDDEKEEHEHGLKWDEVREGSGPGTGRGVVSGNNMNWWMRDSVIEDLKGRVWMVGREGEEEEEG
ncbi:putative APC1 protein [Sordaria brevicollis]|uniref:APC1 protein n=1 Tax=Sordaria brevicollis TaxID=83679 RepID=A0AAE0PI65_SORBR|nr:putative APC1 protein [Sordaria brevicollis]